MSLISKINAALKLSEADEQLMLGLEGGSFEKRPKSRAQQAWHQQQRDNYKKTASWVDRFVSRNNYKNSSASKPSKGSVLDPDEVMAALESDSNTGFCLACGSSQDGVEPDARNYECEACGKRKVCGAEVCLHFI